MLRVPNPHALSISGRHQLLLFLRERGREEEEGTRVFSFEIEGGIWGRVP